MELKLREIRERHALSQEETAHRMHISQSAYARFEATKTKVDLDRLETFASVMGMSLVDVLNFPNNKKQEWEIMGNELSDDAVMTIVLKVQEPKKHKILELLFGNAAV